jgi:hypothetical protein
MKGKSSLAFILAFTLIALGLLAAHNATDILPSFQSDIEGGADRGERMESGRETKVNYPIAPRIESETWFNSPKLDWDDLRGKVVLVEFWTFG